LDQPAFTGQVSSAQASSLRKELLELNERLDPKKLSLSIHNHQEYHRLTKQMMTLATILGEKGDLALAHRYRGIMWGRMHQAGDALQDLHRARQNFEQIRDSRQVALTDMEIGNVYGFLQNNPGMAASFYQRATDDLKRIGQTAELLGCINNLGWFHFKNGDHRQAILCFTELIARNDSSKKPTVSATGFSNIAEVYLEMGNPQRAREYIDLARPLFLSRWNRIDEAHLLDIQGKYYAKTQAWALAEQNYHQSLTIWKQMDRKAKIAEILVSIGECAFHRNRIENAKAFFAQASELYRTIHDQRGKIALRLRMADLYDKTGETTEAEIILEDALAQDKQNGLNLDSYELHTRLSIYAERRGDYKRAFALQKKAVELKEKLIGPGIISEIEALVSHQEKNRITLSLKKEKSLHQSFFFLSLALIFIMALFSFLLLNTLRRKRRDSQHALPPAASEECNKYKTSCLTDDTVHYCINRLESLMNQDKLYLSSELTLSSLARQMNINHSYLSQVINQRFGCHFNDFVNQFRIAEAKRLLQDPAWLEKPILDIAVESGFNALSTFNRLFKAHTGFTPGAYRKRHTPSKAVSGSTKRFTPDCWCT